MKQFKGLAIKHHIYNKGDIKTILKVEVESQHQSQVFTKFESDTTESDDLYVKNYSKGCVVFLGEDLVPTEIELSELSANSKVLNFYYNQTTNEIKFQIFENQKITKRVTVSNGELKQNEGNTLDIEYSGIKGESLFEYLFLEITGEKFEYKCDKELLHFKCKKESNENFNKNLPTSLKSKKLNSIISSKKVEDKTQEKKRKYNSKIFFVKIFIFFSLLAGLGLSLIPKDASKQISENNNFDDKMFTVDEKYCKMYGLPEIDFSCSYSSKLVKYHPEKGEENGKYIAFNIEINSICSEAISINFLEFENYGFKSELFLTKVLESTVTQMEKFDSLKIYESSFGKIKIADKEYLVWRGKGKSIDSNDEYEGDYLLQHIIFLNGKEKNALFLTMCANQDSKIKSFEDFSTKGYISKVLQTLKFNN
jgi:hypothetical protein